MERLRIVLAVLLGVSAAWSQREQDLQFNEADVCGRCHVISVVEWGMSGHRKSGTGCVPCHGESEGHVIDERNNVKPERIPRGEAVSGLCATCHEGGCPSTKKTSACQTCHHFHALVDPNKPAAVRDEKLELLTQKWQRAARHMEEGEKLAALGQWQQARAEFQSALKEKPGDRRAAARLAMCERRLKPGLPGFDIVGAAWDRETGLPHEVRVAGLGIPMVLVPGGDVDLGSEKFRSAMPVHTVRVRPLYLGKFEITREEWQQVMGEGFGKDRLPVMNVSWEDCQAFIAKLNERIPGAGFRLPTEAEWELAARAGSPSAEEAWFGAPEAQFAPQPAGSRKPNKLGIHDLYGNVWEWCSSLFRSYPYNPADGREDTAGRGMRVLRGGSFADTEDLVDPAMRHGERPDRRLLSNGLRIARTVPELK